MRFSPSLFPFVFHMGLILSCFVLRHPFNPILHCLTSILSYLLKAPCHSSHSLGPSLPARIIQAQSTLVAKRGYSCKSPQYVWLWLGLWLSCCVAVDTGTNQPWAFHRVAFTFVRRVFFTNSPLTKKYIEDESQPQALINRGKFP